MKPPPTLHNPQFDGSPFHFAGSRKTAVLLLHGLTATPHEVCGLALALNRVGYTVRGPLLPGHGETPAALSRATWQDWYRVTRAAFAELSAAHPQVVVGGESTGAALALLLAARAPSAAGVLAFAPALRLPLTAARRTLIRALAIFNLYAPKSGLASDAVWQGYQVNSLRAVNQLLRLQDALRPALPQVRQPALIVQGLRDQTIDIRSAQLVFDAIASSRKELHWMERSAHCVLLGEQKEEAFRLALDFLARIEDA